jgi:hypothetical protein
LRWNHEVCAARMQEKVGKLLKENAAATCRRP